MKYENLIIGLIIGSMLENAFPINELTSVYIMVALFGILIFLNLNEFNQPNTRKRGSASK